MRRFWFIPAGLILTIAAVVYARELRPPEATFATASAVCSRGIPQQGDLCFITDCNSTSNCTAGGGANGVLMVYSEAGAAWIHGIDDGGPAAAIAATGTTSETWSIDIDTNNNTISAATDGTFLLNRNESGTVTVTASDDDATAALSVLPGGAAALTLGGASTTNVTVNSDVGLTFANNSDSLNNLADATFDFTRNDAGVVTLTASDDDATAALTVQPGGAAPLTVGGFSATAVQIVADNDTQIWNGATGSVTLDFRDYADTTDDDMAHALFTTNCTDTGSGTEDCDFTIGIVEGGAAAETRLNFDADGGITVGSANTASVNISSADDALTYATNSDRITNATDAQFTFGRDDAGVVTLTCADDDATAGCVYDAGGVSPITVGSADVTAVTLLADNDANVTNGATGSVSLALRDYADTTDDDMDHVLLTGNCTDTGTGTEDCDLTIGIVEGGAAPETRLNFDGDGGIVIGSANTNSMYVHSADNELHFATNDDSISNNTDATWAFGRNDAGIVTLTCADDDATAACTYDAGGASPIVVGSADVTAITLTTDSTGTGEVILPADSIASDEIADTTCDDIIALALDPSEAGATDDYVSLIQIGIVSGVSEFGTTEANVDQYVTPPVSLVAHSLRASVDVAPGVGNDDWRITLRDDGASTALTCDISEAGTSCTDVANAPTIAASSALTVLVHSDIGGGADPTAAGEILISFCLTHD